MKTSFSISKLTLRPIGRRSAIHPCSRATLSPIDNPAIIPFTRMSSSDDKPAILDPHPSAPARSHCQCLKRPRAAVQTRPGQGAKRVLEPGEWDGDVEEGWPWGQQVALSPWSRLAPLTRELLLWRPPRPREDLACLFIISRRNRPLFKPRPERAVLLSLGCLRGLAECPRKPIEASLGDSVKWQMPGLFMSCDEELALKR